jgi:uncharacterized membrane protein YgcG
MRLVWLLAALLMSLAQRGAGAAAVQHLSGRVVDNAALLTPAAREQVSAALRAHEEETNNQIAVALAPRT